MTALDSGYSYEVDNIEKDSWHEILMQFEDSSFYQTWSFGEKKWGRNNISHLVLKKDNSIVSIAQLRTYEFPFVKWGAAYLNWGPVWRLKNSKNSLVHLDNMIRSIYTEYVERRGYYLRILPKIVPEADREAIKRIFFREEYSFSPDPQQTVVVNLSPSQDELWKNLPTGVRKSIRRAKKNDLKLDYNCDERIYQKTRELFKDMKKRKKFFGTGGPDKIIEINHDLPNYFKIKVLTCKYEGEVIAVMGWATFGSVGIPLIGSTSAKALELNAGVLLFWMMIEYFKKHGFAMCDLVGVNPKRNPGGYFFKRRFAGKDYEDREHYIGQFDACQNFGSRFIFKIYLNLKRFYEVLGFMSYKIYNIFSKLTTNQLLCLTLYCIYLD